MSELQVKSKERVRERGEVFTAEREVKAMLNLVRRESERIASRFLEPACGNGNFLVEVLSRKLNTCKRYRKNPTSWERNAFSALTGLYGIDIMADNVRECRERLRQIWHEQAERILGGAIRSEAAVNFLLERNILTGNALSMKMVDENGADTDRPIIFSEWQWLGSTNRIRRSDFRLDVLMGKESNGQQQLYFDFGDDDQNVNNFTNWHSDESNQHGEPVPLKQFSPVNYWEIGNYE